MLNKSPKLDSSDGGRGRPTDASFLSSFDENGTLIPKSGPDTTEEDDLMVNVYNLPNAALSDKSLSEHSERLLYRGGPTPFNTPTGPFSTRSQDLDASMQRISHASGALVAPPPYMPRVPLAEDYVEEDEGGLISSAVEIINTARDLFGAIMGSSSQIGRSWYD